MGVERSEGEVKEVGRAVKRRGDVRQQSEPSYNRRACEAEVMEPILWHRRETRRQRRRRSGS